MRHTASQSEVLFRYLDILKDIERSLLFDVDTCYTDNFENIYSSINRLAPQKLVKCHKNVIVDDSGADEWVLNNPYCVSRTRWEKLAYTVCGGLDVKLKTTDLSCNFTFDLATKTISCDTIAVLSVYEKICDLEYEIKKTDIQCDIEYKLIKEKHPDCDITFNSYKKLTECNMSFDMINQILCDTNSLYVKDGHPVFITPMGEYKVGAGMSFKSIIAPSTCESVLCRGEGTCDLDSASFIRKLMTDYNLTSTQKEEILKNIKK